MAEKKKIAILGGGLGSLTTAILLSEPQYRDQYDITVYQMGWRLGGKGASGRNLEKQSRIEEHGLHLWFGFYDHAFDLIKKCYAENNRPLTKPLATWNEAFKPYNFFVLEENVNNEWIKWALPFPDNDLEPGLGGKKLTMADYASELIRFALESYETYQEQLDTASTMQSRGMADAPLDLRDTDLDEESKRLIEGIFMTERGGFSPFKKMLTEVQNRILARTFTGMGSKLLVILIETFLKSVNGKIDNYVQDKTLERRAWIGISLALSHILGFLRDEVFTQGLGVINRFDYKEWLKRNAASELAYNSAPVNAIYSAFFSYHNSFEAGTAVNIILHLGLKYKGAFYYRMQAGMGDTIFTPMYEVLQKRGVKFQFFHKVERLVMSADQKTIQSVEGAIQVNLKNPTQEYQPLVDIKGLPCWPSMPLYDQIVEGEKLKAEKINLESYWTPWQNVGTFSLKQGVDYDHLVLGIAIGALKDICADIIKAKTAWKNMIDKVIAVPTQALQLWLKPDVAGLGWQFWTKELAFLSTYTDDPLNTWADMSDLIIREEWASDHFPNNISYYCNEYIPEGNIPPPSDHTYPERQLALMRQRSIKAMNENLGEIFPNAVQNQQFNWDLLVDPTDKTGENRIDSQYLRVNVDPTEHYVLSVKGSDAFRLKADGSGFANMTLTGDWIDNQAEEAPMNGGYVEGTVLAGISASKAVIKAV